MCDEAIYLAKDSSYRIFKPTLISKVRGRSSTRSAQGKGSVLIVVVVGLLSKLVDVDSVILYLPNQRQRLSKLLSQVLSLFLSNLYLCYFIWVEFILCFCVFYFMFSFF